MPIVFALVLGLALQAPHDPGSFLVQAALAVEGDSAATVREVWSTAAGAGSGEAVLGLAALDWLEYDTASAASRFRWLTASKPLGPGTLPTIGGDVGRERLLPWAWISRGDALVALGAFERADSAYARALELLDAGDDPRAAAWALLGRAGTLGRLRGTVAALPLLAQVDSLVDEDDAYLRARLHCSRAAVATTPDDRAAEDVEEGLRLSRLAGLRRLAASCHSARAARQIRRGDTNGAAKALAQAARDQEGARDLAGLAATRQWHGYLLRITGSLGPARVRLLEAIAAGEASGNSSPVAWAHLNLAALLAGVQIEDARRHAAEADRLFGSQGDRWGRAALRETQAWIEMQAGRFERARALLEEALEVYGPEGYVPGLLSVHTLRFELALAVDDLEAAGATLLESRASIRELDAGAWARGLDFSEAVLALRARDARRAEAAVERYLAYPTDARQLFEALALRAEAALLRGDTAEAARRLEKGFDFVEGWRDAASDTELLRHLFQLSDARHHDPDFSVATVIAAMTEAGLVSKAYQLAERRRARSLFQNLLEADGAQVAAVGEAGAGTATPTRWIPRLPPVLTPAEVRRRLPESTALLAYLTGQRGEPTTAFLLTKSDLRAWRLPPGDSLAGDIERLVLLAESGRDVGQLARRLGNALLGPVLPALPDGTHFLVVVPDGPLHALPFDLLAPEGVPLVERIAVSVAPSASVAALVWARPRSGRDVVALLAMGDPSFSNEANPGADVEVLRDAFDAEGGLPRLRGSRREARTIARYAPAADVRLRGRASEAGLKGMDLTAYSVIHLATHAQVDPTNPARTALVLAPGGGEDGFLVPAELVDLELDTDLVVLSACRTAGGRLIRGEGIQGLTAPLLQAGARAVLATAWRIPDRAVTALMDDFYRGLATGLPAAEALRTAKLESRSRGEPASVWAAFTLVGDGHASVALREPAPRGALPWLAALGFLGLLGVGLALARRRSA